MSFLEESRDMEEVWSRREDFANNLNNEYQDIDIGSSAPDLHYDPFVGPCSPIELGSLIDSDGTDHNEESHNDLEEYLSSTNRVDSPVPDISVHNSSDLSLKSIDSFETGMESTTESDSHYSANTSIGSEPGVSGIELTVQSISAEAVVKRGKGRPRLNLTPEKRSERIHKQNKGSSHRLRLKKKEAKERERKEENRLTQEVNEKKAKVERIERQIEEEKRRLITKCGLTEQEINRIMSSISFND